MKAAAVRAANAPSDWRQAMLGCRRCPALVASRSRVVPGAGSIPAAVVFVGLAPGRLGGDRTGVPFSGDRSGNLLRSMIAQAGISSFFITNLVRCNPRDERGRNRDPTRAEIEHCRSHLAAELAMVAPSVIVCLGRVAWRELAGAGANFDPLKPTPLSVGGRLIYPMYHPAYVNRGACPPHVYAMQFRRLRRLLDRISKRRPALSGEPGRRPRCGAGESASAD